MYCHDSCFHGCELLLNAAQQQHHRSFFQVSTLTLLSPRFAALLMHGLFCGVSCSWLDSCWLDYSIRFPSSEERF